MCKNKKPFDPKSEEIIDRKKAKEQGRTYFFTGVPCKYGHVERRYVNAGWCYQCKREMNQRDYKKHASRVKESSRKSRKKNWERVKITLQRWKDANREKVRGIKKAWKVRNREQYLAGVRNFGKKKRQDPLYRLSRNTSKSIWESLKKDKAGRRWEELVGYSLQELKEHLESKFVSGMTWENYGFYWELDHVRPLNWCKTFEEAWALQNLQPMECSFNRQKGARYSGSYKPDTSFTPEKHNIG